VRNAAPEGGNLAGRRTNDVAYAPFRARNRASIEAWVAISPEDAITNTARWLNARQDVTIAAWANTPRTQYDLVVAGVGKGLLPCFAGDRDPLLERAGEPVPELHEGQWLVMHNDDRHRPEVRMVIERMVALFTSHAALFAGLRPVGEG
jgi:DNA-binding transcriptional LysR family regulator